MYIILKYSPAFCADAHSLEVATHTELDSLSSGLDNASLRPAKMARLSLVARRVISYHPPEVAGTREKQCGRVELDEASSKWESGGRN
jgi:hypothetical protein